MDAPVTELRVQLDGPGGERWTFGPEHAAQQVTGDAEEFCLVVTQRRHVDDTSLRVVGDDALGWMTQAQAFAAHRPTLRYQRRASPSFDDSPSVRAWGQLAARLRAYCTSCSRLFLVAPFLLASV